MCKSNGAILQIFHREKPCIQVQTGQQLLDIVHTCEFKTYIWIAEQSCEIEDSLNKKNGKKAC